nr:MAG TPA: hypothetical protein [Caudoviricetes sp.]
MWYTISSSGVDAALRSRIFRVPILVAVGSFHKNLLTN